MLHNVYPKIFLMCFTVYLIRVLPFFLFKNEIKNTFLKSFFRYVPYVTLSVMTFPSILFSTGDTLSGWIAFIMGVLTAWLGGNLFLVSGVCCVSVFIVSIIS